MSLGAGQWQQWLMAVQQHHDGGGNGTMVSCWYLLGGSVGSARSVFGWTQLVAVNDNDDDINDVYGTKKWC
eukprot:8791847-Ditylum_brightwellii.AAC.1